MLTPYIICDMDIRATSAEEDGGPVDGDSPTDQAKDAWSFSVGEVHTFPLTDSSGRQEKQVLTQPETTSPWTFGSHGDIHLHWNQKDREELMCSVQKLSFAIVLGLLGPLGSSRDPGSVPACCPGAGTLNVP